jgi:hypothetical protein
MKKTLKTAAIFLIPMLFVYLMAVSLTGDFRPYTWDDANKILYMIFVLCSLLCSVAFLETQEK